TPDGDVGADVEYLPAERSETGPDAAVVRLPVEQDGPGAVQRGRVLKRDEVAAVAGAHVQGAVERQAVNDVQMRARGGQIERAVARHAVERAHLRSVRQQAGRAGGGDGAAEDGAPRIQVPRSGGVVQGQCGATVVESAEAQVDRAAAAVEDAHVGQGE